MATASCIRAYENLDLHSSPILAGLVFSSKTDRQKNNIKEGESEEILALFAG